MANLKILFGFIIISLFCVKLVLSCEMDQTQHGCRIDNGACTCSFGCKSEFRYSNRKECQDALKGTSNDICSRKPCLNNGACIQVSYAPGYKCRCEGTGYWGSRCQRLCPDPNDHSVQSGAIKYPTECITI